MIDLVQLGHDFYWELGGQLYRGIHGSWQDAASVFLPYMLSIMTIIAVMRQGDKDVTGWWLTLVNQFGWIIWMLCSHTYGLLILNLFMWYATIRNILLWRKTK